MIVLNHCHKLQIHITILCSYKEHVKLAHVHICVSVPVFVTLEQSFSSYLVGTFFISLISLLEIPLFF